MEITWVWPAEVTDYLQCLIFDLRKPAYLLTDTAGTIISSGGNLATYGLTCVEAGEQAADRASVLEGLIPLDTTVSTLTCVEVTEGVFADLHLFRIPQGHCVLFLDVSAEAAERTRIEQALRDTEEQLQHAERMEALGRLAGGVAHDFNNLLTVMLGYSRLISEGLPPEQFRFAIEEISRSAERAAIMTRRLLSFSRRQVHHPEVLDLNVIVSNLQHILRRLIGEDIALILELESPLSAVEADAGQIEQVLVNLAANARDSMPDGGKIEIRTANIFQGEQTVIESVSGIMARGSAVSLTVTDTGSGMDEGTRKRAFEPFYTSKAPGNGTGLGLSIVHAIISNSGGTIELVSSPGEGTKVEIILPAVSAAPADKPEVSDGQLPTGSETVLVVEDEERVSRLVCEILCGLGYRVLNFGLPAEALAAVEQYPNRIDLLVTDYVMPEMNGAELATRICASRPETQVLYLSGYAEESLARRVPTPPPGVFLGKPFTPAILAQAVRKALHQTATSTGTP